MPPEAGSAFSDRRAAWRRPYNG